MGMTRETEVLRAWDGVVVDNKEERQAEIPRKGSGVFPAAGGVGCSGGRGLWENLHDLMRTSGYRHQHMKSEKTLETVATGCLLWKSESLCQEAGEGGVTENTPSRAPGVMVVMLWMVPEVIIPARL